MHAQQSVFELCVINAQHNKPINTVGSVINAGDGYITGINAVNARSNVILVPFA